MTELEEQFFANHLSVKPIAEFHLLVFESGEQERTSVIKYDGDLLDLVQHLLVQLKGNQQLNDTINYALDKMLPKERRMSGRIHEDMFEDFNY